MGNLVKLKYIGGYSLAIATGLQVLEENKHWKVNLKAMVLLQMICETLTHFAIEDSEDEALFQLVYETVTTQSSEQNYVLQSAFYLLKLLQISGSLPDLTTSAVTGEKLNSTQLYVEEDTLGYVSSSQEQNKFDERIYKTQRYATNHTIYECMHINLNEGESIRFINQMFNWVEIVIERSLKSRKVVSNILR